MKDKSLKLEGVYKDIIRYSDGRVEETDWSHNLIVNSALNILTALLGNTNGYKGIQYWAVGSGLASWDTTMPNPNSNAVALTSEIGRKVINSSNIRFLTETGEPSNTPTNKIEVSCFFEANDCIGVWREFGLFGGNATSAPNSGILIDKKHHQIINKTNDMTVERTIVFTLNLV